MGGLTHVVFYRKGEANRLSFFILILGEIRFLPDVYATAQN
jgi:hypothetical protein